MLKFARPFVPAPKAHIYMNRHIIRIYPKGNCVKPSKEFSTTSAAPVFTLRQTKAGGIYNRIVIYYTDSEMLKTERRGRPYLVATIPFQNQQKVALLDKFYTLLSSAKYQEIMQLSRGMGVTPRTVERWKYRESFPRWDVALDVIAWYEQGKPVTRCLPYRHGRGSQLM